MDNLEVESSRELLEAKRFKIIRTKMEYIECNFNKVVRKTSVQHILMVQKYFMVSVFAIQDQC